VDLKINKPIFAIATNNIIQKTNMNTAKKLIEVAMPIKEISAESVRDKSIRHGHISTLHLWWARRPLPVCRAVVFASLVPDPLDALCPKAFVEAVADLLGDAAYQPYEDIPYTVGEDKMDDNARHRLLMFIGKFSDAYVKNAKDGNTTASKDMLAPQSLIKWDNKNNESILRLARLLIFVAHNAAKQPNYALLVAEFDRLTNDIKTNEKALYALIDRHQASPEAEALQAKVHAAVEAFLDKMPNVFDPFAGGGAIPLEAARLGCRTFGNDINPVAHIIQRASLQFPQQFGKPITMSKAAYTARYGESKDKQQTADTDIFIPNRLSHDVEHYALRLLAETEKAIGHFYPADEKGNKPIAYYWAYSAKCVNPSCQADVPLVKQFYLVNKPDKKIHLKPIIDGNKISFELHEGEIKADTWLQRKNLKCPCCGNITDVKELKRQFNNKETKQHIVAVIEEGANSKAYRLPRPDETAILSQLPKDTIFPAEKMPVGNGRDLHCMGWGVETWGDMFSHRQVLALNTLIEKLTELKKEFNVEQNEYEKAIITYLAILVDRIVVINTSFGRYNVSGEKLEHLFSKQAIPMMFDYPESNLFCSSSGSAKNQLEWIIRYIESECNYPFPVKLTNASSGDYAQFADKYLTAVVTDPPYYDAIAYADLSDFFYVWLKRSLGDIYPMNFITPQTPKAQECTALKHHHDDNINKARAHFEHKLLQIFAAIEKQTSDVVSIMFAHQSTDAWTTLCNSILGANMNITGSWAVDTEMVHRTIGLAGAALASSVTVACRPTERGQFGEYRDVRRAIEATVTAEVLVLYKLGFRGADLLTACFGKAVSEFGKYEMVEKADGTEVSVAELLDLARDTAFNTLLKGFEGDEQSKFYIGWLQLYGFAETDFDDVAKFSKVGLSINASELFDAHLLVKRGNKQTLATSAERVALAPNLGEKLETTLIDRLHRVMFIYNNRKAVIDYLRRHAIDGAHGFWRVATALAEILPADTPDGKTNLSLLSNKDLLLREMRQPATELPQQTDIFAADNE
jgi:putative DNA methylase